MHAGRERARRRSGSRWPASCSARARARIPWAWWSEPGTGCGRSSPPSLIAHGPGRSGVYARFASGGARCSCSIPHGHVVRTLGAGRGTDRRHRADDVSEPDVAGHRHRRGRGGRRGAALTPARLRNTSPSRSRGRPTSRCRWREARELPPAPQPASRRARGSRLRVLPRALAVAALPVSNPLVLGARDRGASLGAGVAARVSVADAARAALLAAAAGGADRGHQRAGHPRRADRDPAARQPAGARPHRHHAGGHGVRRESSGCGRVALILCGALYTAAVDPDEVLRLFRRVSFRSALTATLATRMVPGAGARLAAAGRCAALPARAAALAACALMRAATAGVLDRALDVAAALEVRGYGAARRPRPDAPPLVAPRPRLLRRRGRGCWRSPSSRAVAGLGAAAGLSALHAPVDAGRAGPGRRRCPCCALSPFADRRGVGAVSVLELDQVTYSLSRPRRARARPTCRSRSSRASWSSWRAPRGRASRRCCGRPAGSCRTSTAAVRRPGDRGRDGHPRRTARASSPAPSGTLFQDPETQVVMGTVRAELALPAGEPRRAGGRGGPRGGGGGAGARDRPPARPLDRRAVRRRAPAGGARRRAGRPPAAGRARRADLAARSGGRRRADRTAAAAQRGLRHHRCCWPSTASSAVWARPTG